MGHWNEERDRRRVEMMRKCGPVTEKHKDLIDKYEETGDDIYWVAFIRAIRKEKAACKETPSTA